MRRRVGLALAMVVLAASATTLTEAAAAAPASIVRTGTSTATYRAKSTTSIVLRVPSTSTPGDVLVATVGYGDGTGKPTLAAPSGWTLASQTYQKKVSASVYVKVLAAGETSFTWKASTAVGGEGILASFSGVDPARPVDGSKGAPTTGSSIATPSLTTTSPGSMLVASFVGFRGGAASTTWTPASGMTEIADVIDGGRQHSASVDVAVQAAAGSTGSKVARASASQDGAVGVLTALRPATVASPTPPPPSGPIPLIVDTDLFSDADDVGALATAYGLQRQGEAKVIAVGINTRLSRPAVAADSWKCAAAVNAFYGSASVPIGTALPNDGTEKNVVDFIGPCAKLAPTGTAVPASAVTVFRRALAAQPDGSVVIAEAGYAGNLAALLASPGDAISPLNGRDLIAAKVRSLVVMGGGYPSRNGENNLVGDPGAAQSVAANWPTKVVWAGYEVGDLIRTGDTISRTHPASSPVRVAYEAFVGPNNWIYSYDLVAVFHAIRSSSASLALVGPGTNRIDANGANTFVLGAGNQYYLKLLDAAALDAAIETLITTLPIAPSGPTDAFDAGTLDPATWTTTSSGSVVSVSGGLLRITHRAGAWTKAGVRSSSPFDLTGRSVGVELVRAANGGAGGTAYGETSVAVAAGPDREVRMFVAGGSLTAWTDVAGVETNLTPTWPRYDPTAMRWLRIRESAGRLSFEYAAARSGPWVVLASAASPFAPTSVSLSIAAGANTTVDDTAAFDNVFTS